jgi:hypothetical protein
VDTGAASQTVEYVILHILQSSVASQIADAVNGHCGSLRAGSPQAPQDSMVPTDSSHAACLECLMSIAVGEKIPEMCETRSKSRFGRMVETEFKGKD